MSSLGDLVIKGFLSSTIGIACIVTKLDDINECDVPDSSSTVASMDSTKNPPSTTPGTS